MSNYSLSSPRFHFTLLAFLSVTTVYSFWKSHRLRTLKPSPQNPNPNPSSPQRGKLFFVSQTGTSKTLATRLFHLLNSNNFPFDLIDPSTYEPGDLPKETLLLIVASTWEDNKPPQSCRFFADWLSDSAEDFRVGSLLHYCRV